MPPKSFLIFLLCVLNVWCFSFQDGGLMMQQQHQLHHHRHHRILDNSHSNHNGHNAHHPSFRHEHHRHHVLMDSQFPPPSLPLIDSTMAPPPNHQQIHHLRHHNKQKQTWEKRVFPALRTLQTLTSTSTIDPLTMTSSTLPATTTTEKSIKTTTTMAKIDVATLKPSPSSPVKITAIQSNYSRRFFDPDEFNSKSVPRRIKDATKLSQTSYKFDPYALPLSDKPHFEFPVNKKEKKVVNSKSMMMRHAAWDADADTVDDGVDDIPDEDSQEENNGDESLSDRGDNNDLRDRHKMLNDEIYGLATGSINNRRGSRSSKYLQVCMFCYFLIIFWGIESSSSTHIFVIYCK